MKVFKRQSKPSKFYIIFLKFSSDSISGKERKKKKNPISSAVTSHTQLATTISSSLSLISTSSSGEENEEEGGTKPRVQYRRNSEHKVYSILIGAWQWTDPVIRARWQSKEWIRSWREISIKVIELLRVYISKLRKLA